MNDKLKPCPLCGSGVTLHWGDCHRIQCNNCNIEYRGAGAMRKDDVIASWNNNGEVPSVVTDVNPMLKHADVVKGGACADCGYPAIRTTTNNDHPMLYQGWDYWQYCINKGCQNHTGEAYAQHNSEWFVECAE